MNKQSVARNSITPIAWIIRMLLGAIFVVAAIAKLRSPHEFLAGVYNYEIVGEAPGIAIAVIVPWFELTIGLCLLTNILSGGCHLAAFLLGMVFFVIQAWAIHRNLQISCSCFGNLFSRSSINYTSLLRSAALNLAAATGYACWLDSGSLLARAPVAILTVH